MTAILSFFIENGNKFIVIADRQVTYNYELREKDKFFKKGRFYIFCSGSEDVYSQIISEINSNRSNISRLANFIKDKVVSICNNSRRAVGITDDYLSFVIIDTKSLKASLINRGTVNKLTNFNIIGSGENYIQYVYDIFSKLAPNGFQLNQIKFNEKLIVQKIIESYHTLSLKQSSIGHPAKFGLDLFIFSKRKTEQFRINFKHDIKDGDNYQIKSIGR